MKFIDLFCGLGGFRLALEKRKGQCVFSADFDKYVCDSYQKNFNDYPLIDISLFDKNTIPDHDILCAGFPCQPFSIAGHRKGFDDVRGTLFFDILTTLKNKSPDAFILENVKGLLSHDSGKTFSSMLNHLAAKVNNQEVLIKSDNNLGYNVFWKVISAQDHNLPQNRQRIFIIGFKNQSINYRFPKTKIQKIFLSNILDKNPIKKDISKLSKGYIHQYLKNHKKYNDIKNLDYLIAYEIRKSKVSFKFDNNSPCLTTKMGTGGNNVPYLVNHNRFLTLKECLKLQGFPEDFKLTDSYSQSLRQIGNSVAIPVVQSLVDEIIACLN
tara:strand:- start:4 stop:978 length:975 start_codon:yes stop_codon:yes gene_type:complete